jgi:hypothetical protein
MKLTLLEPYIYEIERSNPLNGLSVRDYKKVWLKAEESIAYANFYTKIKLSDDVHVHVVVDGAQKWTSLNPEQDFVYINQIAIEQYYRIYLLSGINTFTFAKNGAMLKFDNELASIYKHENTIFYEREVTKQIPEKPIAYVIGTSDHVDVALIQLSEQLRIYCEAKNYNLDVEIVDTREIEAMKETVETQFGVKLLYFDGKKATLAGPNKKKAFSYINSMAVTIMKNNYDLQLKQKEESSANMRMAIGDLNNKMPGQFEMVSKYPQYWENMDSKPLMKLQMFTLSSGSFEYSNIEGHFHETLLHSSILKIERIQNTWTWNHYLTELINFKEDNISPNERYFFHGTKANPPSKIISSEVGLDLIYCNGGMWGKGVYLASKASYSDTGYAYIEPNGNKQLFYVKAIMGETVKLPPGHYNDLPLNHKTNRKYDSLSDNTPNPTIYVVKRSTQTYPEYLITYK